MRSYLVPGRGLFTDCHRYGTNSSIRSAEKGLALITELITASDTPITMTGTGIRVTNVVKFLQAGRKATTVLLCRYQHIATQMSLHVTPLTVVRQL